MKRKRSNVFHWLEWGTRELSFLETSEARSECEVILETLLGVPRFRLYLAEEIPALLFPHFAERVEARKNRIPLAYLLKEKDFWEERFLVEEGIFIPRPETETLIEAFLKDGGFREGKRFSFLDLGAGSGNIAVTLAKLFPEARGMASDLDSKALAVARKNASQMGAHERLRFIQADGLAPFRRESFDLIFSNPPYVPSRELKGLELEVQKEPGLALDGGEDGLDFYRKTLRELFCLKKGGALWVEVGWGEAQEVKSLFEKAGFSPVQIYRDLTGVERVVSGKEFNG